MTITIVVENEINGATAQTLIFDEPFITIGSGATANVVLPDARVAPEQAVILNETEQPFFINSSDGTIYNGAEIGRGLQRDIRDGDAVKIGGFNLIFKFADKFAPVPTIETPKENEPLPVADDEPEDLVPVTALLPRIDEIPVEVPKPPRASDEFKSFADILTSLRKEEDQFYFQVADEYSDKRRLPLEREELLLGWNLAGGMFSADIYAEIDKPQAIVRKDWSGVTIYPNGDEAILLNGSLLEAPEKLKNNDRMTFARRKPDNSTETVQLTFCEPAALVELNQILPQELLSTALETNKPEEVVVQPVETTPAETDAQAKARRKKERKKNRRYFGYFTGAEIMIMIFATILTAALVYVVLEFS